MGTISSYDFSTNNSTLKYLKIRDVGKEWIDEIDIDTCLNTELYQDNVNGIVTSLASNSEKKAG